MKKITMGIDWAKKDSDKTCVVIMRHNEDGTNTVIADFHGEVAEYIAQLHTQLQDANRKLAALGHESTRELIELVVKPLSPKKAKELDEAFMRQAKRSRSINQQEWDDYETGVGDDFGDAYDEYLHRLWKNHRQTRKDAYNSGNP